MTTLLETSTVPGLKRLYFLSVLTAAVGGLFCALFVAILLYNIHVVSYSPIVQSGDPIASEAFSQTSDPTYRLPATDPFNLLPTDQKTFLALKRQLAGDRQNESLKERIRGLDRELRLDYFKRREVVRRTSPLLFISVVVFLIAAKTASVLKRRLPVPTGDPSIRARREEESRLRLGIMATVAFGMLLIGIAVGLWAVPAPSFEQVLVGKLRSEEPLPTGVATGAEPGVPVSDPIDSSPVPVEEPPLDRDAMLVELQKNWPSFRGFDGSGTGRSDNPPVRWDAVTGERIAWKTEVPLPGKSSPVVWENRVFLSGADEQKRQIFCFDVENGKLLWTTDAPSTPESEKTVHTSEDTGFAAPTMVVDGRRAFALFANGDLVAVDFDGKVVWSRSLGIPESAYGFSSSPALYFDRLIVQYDVGDGTDGKSKLYAFDVKTGDVVWETPRAVPNSWSSPMVAKIGERWQIVTCGDPFVISYDPESGDELWRCKCLGGDVGPSPTVRDPVVFITNQIPRSTAIDAAAAARTGGDVTETCVLWRGINALPDTPSPFASETAFYTLDSHGYLTAYDPGNVNEKNKRAMFWELEIGGGEAAFYSSPLRVGNFMYAFDMSEESPQAFVVDLAKAKTDDSGALSDDAAESMVAATNPMPEPCVATPAVVGGRLFIRGSKSLFCITSEQ